MSSPRRVPIASCHVKRAAAAGGWRLPAQQGANLQSSEEHGRVPWGPVHRISVALTGALSCS